MKRIACSLFFSLLFGSAPIGSAQAQYKELVLSETFLQSVQNRYGTAAVSRINAWQQLIKGGVKQTDWQRIHEVNHFFNRRLRYASDIDHWLKNDYWATPIEFLGSGAGDCEDYAIAKYFSLRAMGVPNEKLRLMYVRALTVNEPHMVLVYFEKPEAMPLVLDNMVLEIKSAADRPDLKPVYSFNAEGLWLAKANGLGKKVNQGGNIANWSQVLERIEQGL